MYVPRARTTTTRQPLSLELRKIVAKSLRDEYVKVYEVESDVKEDSTEVLARLESKPVQNCLLITIHKWEIADGIKECVFKYDFEATVFDSKRKKLADNRIDGEKSANTLGKGFPVDIYAKLYKEAFEELFGNERLLVAISGN